MSLPVTILRDAYGVPHIFAETETAAAFGMGWAQAEDRLESLLRNYKQARGELCEIDGETALAGDVRVRAFRLAEIARKRYDRISPPMRENIEAFCAGVNRFQAEQPGKTPAWAFAITPADVVAFALFINLAFASDPAERLPGEAVNGSNAFVVAARKTATGRGSLTSIDPHLPWHGFLRWYEARVCAGAMNVSGITLAGLPLIIMGHNGRVAWANTVNAPDLSDLYEERVIVENGQPIAYEYDGAPRPLTLRALTFRVRQPDGTHREQTVPLACTHHGPLLLSGSGGGGNTAFAVRKAGWGDVGLFDQVWAQSLAQSVDEYRAALTGRHVVMFNHLFADDTGRIGYVWAGQIPRRPPGYDFRAAVPGWTSATEWGDPVPFAELPQALNPPSGFLQNANDGPFTTGAGAALTPSADASEYPHWLAPNLRTLRGTRLRTLLEAEPVVSLETAQRIATDTLDLHAARELAPLLAAARAQQEGSPENAALLTECVRVLSAWDGRLTMDARGAALFQAWLWDARIQPLVGGFIERTGAEPLAAGPGRSVAVAALADAARSLRAQGVPLDVPWGIVHRHRRGSVDLPMDGGGESLVPNSGAPDAEGRIVAGFGSSFRMLVELGNGPARAWSASPYGVSDDPASPHFADQMPLAAARQYRPVPWTREAVEQEATARVTLAVP